MTNLNALLTAAGNAQIAMRAAKAEYAANRTQKNKDWFVAANREWNRIWAEIERLPR